MKSGDFNRGTKPGRSYLIEFVTVSLLFAARQAAYDEAVEEGLWASGPFWLSSGIAAYC